ncbi:hypothetical protein IVB56_21255 [Bradyrhizobium sp. CW7]|uniref:nuclear transport factor 2 family protein n=1 Tax=Bradyrhizobium sp. CW7 TaxID=2782688 RepID=UPI001FF9FFCF|nr:nuclear transport factor 2 family protein [Bradyrhizobium sp. CW7]MCK1353547.1 hypothetical protein [Bradyrhizobium sp. CW7]
MNRILVDDRFKTSVLEEVLAPIQASPAPTVVRSNLIRLDALIRLRIAQEATGSKKPEEADAAAAVAEDRLNSYLALNPADSFLWLMLYSIENMRNGFDARMVGFLDQSYKSGPLEGWIALRRNRLALAAYPALNETIRDTVISEFAGLVASDFTEGAALNLVGIGWGQRDRLLTSLQRVDIVAREALAKRLLREGVTVNVPGVQIDERLWRQ